MKKSVLIGGLIGAGVLFIILLAILMTGIFVIASLIVLLLAVIILLFVGFVIGGFIGFIAIKNKLKRKKWLILIIILIVVGIIVYLYFFNPNVLNPTPEQNWCTERKESCPKIINQVCGCFIMRCEIPPCPEKCRPFENSCFACLNHADYWTLGKCPECKKDPSYCEKDEDCICEQDRGCFMGNIKYYTLCVSNERKSTTSCQDVCAQQQCKCENNTCDCGHGFA